MSVLSILKQILLRADNLVRSELLPGVSLITVKSRQEPSATVKIPQEAYLKGYSVKMILYRF